MGKSKKDQILMVYLYINPEYSNILENIQQPDFNK